MPQNEFKLYEINDWSFLGAAGAIESIASIMAIQNNVVPPTINQKYDDQLDHEINQFWKPQKREINIALSNTFDSRS